MPRVESAREVVVTEAILVELGACFPTDRWDLLRNLIDGCYATPNVTVVPIDEPLLKRVLAAYEGYADKTWSLTDCISFVVMKDRGITEAATSDSDFTQAKFSALLR